MPEVLSRVLPLVQGGPGRFALVHGAHHLLFRHTVMSDVLRLQLAEANPSQVRNHR